MTDIKKLEQIASQVRRDIVRMVHGAKSGHPGGSLGCADFLTALYFEVLKHNPSSFSMEGKGEDVFILSNGHISPVFYSVLARSGYFDVKELSSFRALNSRLQGHPATKEKLEGVRVATGSLGQGLSYAAGVALAKKLDKDPSFVYCLCGDGEIQEGQIWEAVMYTAHNKLNNVILTIDFNGRQIDGDTKDIMGFEELNSKFAAFGWQVIEMDGNNMADVVEKLHQAKFISANNKPVCIIMKTEMGAGVDYMMGSHKWHGIAPSDDDLAKALNQLPETLGDY